MWHFGCFVQPKVKKPTRYSIYCHVWQKKVQNTLILEAVTSKWVRLKNSFHYGKHLPINFLSVQSKNTVSFAARLESSNTLWEHMSKILSSACFIIISSSCLFNAQSFTPVVGKCCTSLFEFLQSVMVIYVDLSLSYFTHASDILSSFVTRHRRINYDPCTPSSMILLICRWHS